MDFLTLLEQKRQIALQSSKQIDEEQLVVDTINELDYSNPVNVQQAEQYIQKTLSSISRNESISRLQAKTTHCMIVKMHLHAKGLDNVAIKYEHKPRGNAGAFYRDSDKSITFFDDPESEYSVGNARYFLNTYGKTREIGEFSRLEYFNKLTHAIFHEIQHAVQFDKMAKQRTTTSLEPSIYIMDLQDCARYFSRLMGTKYHSKEKIDKLYKENHDEFLYELDSDLTGYHETLGFLEKISPNAHQVALAENGNNFTEKIEQTTSKIENINDVLWQHSTNANETGVGSNYKASLIIDDVLPLLSDTQRQQVFQDYPMLQITHKFDGSRKTLTEVEAERDSELQNLLGSNKAASVQALYETVINSNAMLKFEKTLRELSTTKDHSTIRAGKDIASKIASYMENSNYSQAMEIYKQYGPSITSHSNPSNETEELFSARKLAGFTISSELGKNRYLKKEKNKEIKKAREERQKKEEATKIIKSVFNGFQPSPLTGTFLPDGKLELKPNLQEKMLLEFSLNNYRKNLANQTHENPIPLDEVEAAIRLLYPQIPTQEERDEFNKQTKQGEILALENCYDEKQAIIQKLSQEEFEKLKQLSNKGKLEPTRPYIRNIGKVLESQGENEQ